MSNIFNIKNLTWESVRILKAYAPVRDWRVYSKYGPPGNLKNNAINPVFMGNNNTKVVVGGDPAPYAPYTETRSRRKYWMRRSRNRIIKVIENKYGGTRA